MEENNTNIDNKTSQEIFQKVKDAVEEQKTLTSVESIIKSASPQFTVDGVEYRVSAPTYKQKQEAYDRKVEKFNQLLSDDKYMLEDVLKAKYKAKGVDIDRMFSDNQYLEVNRNNLQYKLGELLKKTPEDTEGAKSLKEEIEKIEQQQYLLSIKKTNLLQYSIENQVLIYVYQYLTYLVTEKKEGDKWVPAWSSFDDFRNSNEKLVNTASFNATMVIGQV